MARMTEFQPLYDAFRLFQERCLINDHSMLWPDQSIWTLANLQRWKTQVIDHPNIRGDLNFNDKLQQQLAGAPPILWGIAADLHYIYYLPSSNITLATRLGNIGWAAQQAGFVPPPDSDPIWIAHQHGFTHTTQKYHFRYAQFHLLAMFALRLKENRDASQTLADPDRVQTLLDEILDGIPAKSDRAYDMRHAILYLMFPDRYERIISTRDKERIVEVYGEHISNHTVDLDAKLRQIRQELSKKYPEVAELDFYRHLKMEWRPDEQKHIVTEKILGPGEGERSEVKSEEAGIVSDVLRLLKRFKNLILFGPPGTGKTYWADQIAKRLIDPQLKQSLSKSAYLQTVIEELPFYDILALGIHVTNPNGQFTVPELEKMELVQARFRQNPINFPKNQIWGVLQAHSDPESQTVRFSSRAEPYLFDKTTDSRWYLTDAGKEYVQETLKDRLNLINQGPPATNKPEDFIRWVTFHQNYAYEDFVEGLRPKSAPSESNTLSFEIKPGTFRSLCARAQADANNQYVLVIDEINRGNIAKVFGELMTLIEADKRGSLSVELPYSKEIFQIPANLAIIGTMNTADRSIALLDVALRRRFAFLELTPDPELLDQITISIVDEDPLNLGECLRKINQRISELRGGDYQIGHSYFLPLMNISQDKEKLAYLDDIWNYQVVPLLKEYFYGQGDLLRQVLPSFFNLEEGEIHPANIDTVVLHGEDLVAALNKL